MNQESKEAWAYFTYPSVFGPVELSHVRRIMGPVNSALTERTEIDWSE